MNAGVSGDTSAGGLARLDWALDGDVRVLIVALGGNDGAARPAGRGAAAATCRRSSSARRRAASRSCSPAWKRRRTTAATTSLAFTRSIRRWPQQYHVALVPFLLQGVAGNATLNQRDGIHPTADGARIVADNVWARARSRSPERRDGAPEGVPDHDRAARRFEDGDERHRAAHHSPPALAADSARPVRRDRRAVGQRQVDAARADRRPRRAHRPARC